MSNSEKDAKCIKCGNPGKSIIFGKSGTSVVLCSACMFEGEPNASIGYQFAEPKIEIVDKWLIKLK